MSYYIILFFTYLPFWSRNVDFVSAAIGDKMCPGYNEVYSSCDAHCDIQCEDVSKILLRMVCNPKICTPGCICATGTARNLDNVCVPTNLCEQRRFSAPSDKSKKKAGKLFGVHKTPLKDFDADEYYDSVEDE